MKIIRTLSLVWLSAIACFVWGILVVQYKIFPWNEINPILLYIDGHVEDKTTVVEKVLNDLNVVPKRFLTEEFPESLYRQLVSKRSRPSSYQELPIEGMNSRRLNPLVYKSGNTRKDGYYFIFGILDFDENVHGAVLLNDQADVVHSWVMEETSVRKMIEIKNNNEEKGKSGQEGYMSPEKRFPHGVELFQDGSIIYNDGDRGNGIRKINYCGDPVWTTLGGYNHVVQKGISSSSVWALRGGGKDKKFVMLSAEDGKVVKTIAWKEVRKINKDIGLDLRYSPQNRKWYPDPYHFNDIDPLPESLARLFPQFETGDLLLSLRSLNLIVVMDPETYEIKWRRMGDYRRQHDPDWDESGSITVFNNNRRGQAITGPWQLDRYSSIASIDPKTYETEMLFDGRNEHFYTSIRGKHQVLPDKNILVTSSQQGRVLEVNRAGEIVFEFINRYDNDRNLRVSEAKWVPQDFFEFNVGDKARCNQ